MPSKCAQVGHGFCVERATKKETLERCEDCGLYVQFKISSQTDEAEYMRAHRRDYIQPYDRENWNIAYPDKKIIDDPIRKAEMQQTLNEKFGKKRLPKVAEEYFRTYGGSDSMALLLKWHFGLEEYAGT